MYRHLLVTACTVCIAKLEPGLLCFCGRAVLLSKYSRDDTTQTLVTRLVVVQPFAVHDLRPRVVGFSSLNTVGVVKMTSATVDYNATLVVNAINSQRAKFESCAEVSGGRAVSNAELALS